MTNDKRPRYSAKMRIPCAVLGIRTAQGAVTGVEYLPSSERAQAPTDALAARVVAQIENYLADPHFTFTLPLAAPAREERRGSSDSSAGPVGSDPLRGPIRSL